LVALLAGLNAATYVQKQTAPDSEVVPNRSTFNTGTTGTQAFYTLLAESGRKVIRWQVPPAALLTAGTNAPNVFVVTGTIRRDFEPNEVEELLRWVSSGGRLVIIDHEPPEGFLTTTANWNLKIDNPQNPWLFTIDASDQKQMIGDTAAVKPVQPTLLTQNVNAIQPSRFVSSVTFTRFFDGSKPPVYSDTPPPAESFDLLSGRSLRLQNAPAKAKAGELYQMPSPTPVEPFSLPVDEIASPSQIAPLAHFAAGDKNIVVDAPFGNGRIVMLTDPFIISNGGIALVDNAQLGINLVSTVDGVVAFDEFHQGYGSDNNRFLQFFEGTPVIAIFLQMALLIGLVFFSQSRRFARPVPEPEPDRLSKLEYVAAMAELQIRT
jgi:hypothetical protein